MIRRSLLSAVTLAIALCAAPASHAAGPRQITVAGTRIKVGDVIPDADPAIASLDLGPAPVAGGARVVTRDEIVAACDAQQLPTPHAVPQAVRVVRKTKRVAPAEMDALVRGALAARPLRRGVSLDAVREDHAVDVADGWTRVDVDLPRPPKREGPFHTTAIVSFLGTDGELFARLQVPVAIAVTAEGTTYDAPRGATITLVVRREFVEVRVPGTAAADADVGDALPVRIRISGRTVPARLVASDEAIAVEPPR